MIAGEFQSLFEAYGVQQRPNGRLPMFVALWQSGRAQFRSARIGARDQDRDRLAKMLDLGVRQEPIEWDTTSRAGKDFGPDWKDYRVELTKVIVEKSAPDRKANAEWFEVLPNDPNKMSCLIC